MDKIYELSGVKLDKKPPLKVGDKIRFNVIQHSDVRNFTGQISSLDGNLIEVWTGHNLGSFTIMRSQVTHRIVKKKKWQREFWIVSLPNGMDHIYRNRDEAKKIVDKHGGSIIKVKEINDWVPIDESPCKITWGPVNPGSVGSGGPGF